MNYIQLFDNRNDMDTLISNLKNGDGCFIYNVKDGGTQQVQIIEKSIFSKCFAAVLVNGNLVYDTELTYVTSAAINKFGRNQIKYLYLGDNVVNIAPLATQALGKIEKVYFSDSVTTIGENAFMGSKFETFEFPKTLTYINSGVLNNCDNLKDVTIYPSVQVIESAFEGIGTEGTLHCNRWWYENLNDEQKLHLGNLIYWKTEWI